MSSVFTDEAGEPILPVEMKAIHQENHERGSDVRVVKETEEIEERKYGEIQRRYESFGLFVKLKI